MIGHLLFNLLFCGGQAVVLIFEALALFTNNWIKEVETQNEDDSYFHRVSSLDQQFVFDGNDDIMTSIGLWRMWARNDKSYPLPIIDTEVRMALGSYTVCLAIGSMSLYVVSFQLFGLFRNNIALEVIIGWATFFQACLCIAATSTAMGYFKNTFSYSGAGFSLFSGWIAVVFCLLLGICTVFRVMRANKAVKEEAERKSREKPMQTYEKLTIRSVPSETRLYNPPPGQSSRPTTAERNAGQYVREGSRPGTMQSQHDYGMRRAGSYDSKQFDMHNGDNYMYYDQGDIPRHIK